MDDSNSTARHKVFAIPELAEAIFLQLNMSDLLCGVVQTSKAWKAIVDTSVKLQQALFFKPIPTKLIKYRVGQEYRGPWRTVGDDAEVENVYEHPLIARLYGLNEYEDEMNWDAMKRSSATWRQALVTQPPAVSIAKIEGRLVENSSGVRMGELEEKETDGQYYYEPFGGTVGWYKWKMYEGYFQLEALMRNPVLKKEK